MAKARIITNEGVREVSDEVCAALEPFVTDLLDAGVSDSIPDDRLFVDIDQFSKLTVGDFRRALAAYRKARGETL